MQADRWTLDTGPVHMTLTIYSSSDWRVREKCLAMSSESPAAARAFSLSTKIIYCSLTFHCCLALMLHYCTKIPLTVDARMLMPPNNDRGNSTKRMEYIQTTCTYLIDNVISSYEREITRTLYAKVCYMAVKLGQWRKTMSWHFSGLRWKWLGRCVVSK